jgi:hypothetical protein
MAPNDRTEPGVCIECKHPLIDCPGIGPYCPNRECKRIDDQRPESTGQQPAYQYQQPPKVTTGMAVFGQQPAQPGSGEVKRYVGRITELEPSPVQHVVLASDFERLQSALAAERGKLAAWMIQHNFVTGHGDTTDDLLAELGAQVDELAQQLTAAQQENKRLDARWRIVSEINDENMRVREARTRRAEEAERKLTAAQQRYADGLEAWKANNAHFAARIAELREALRHYGWHKPECDYMQEELPCTCGFRDVIEERA